VLWSVFVFVQQQSSGSFSFRSAVLYCFLLVIQDSSGSQPSLSAYDRLRCARLVHSACNSRFIRVAHDRLLCSYSCTLAGPFCCSDYPWRLSVVPRNVRVLPVLRGRVAHISPGLFLNFIENCASLFSLAHHQ